MSATRLNKRARRIMKEYMNEDWNTLDPIVKMKIGVQGFSVQTYGNSIRAKKWMRKMLAHALDKFLDMEAAK